MQMQIIIDKFLRNVNSYQYKLNAYDRILMVILASYMGNKTTCWPSHKSLEIDCGMSKWTLIKSTKKLESLVLLKVIREKEENNIYEFCAQVVANSNYLVANSYQGVVAVSYPNNIIVNNIINKDSHVDKKSIKKTRMPNELRKKLGIKSDGC